MSGIGGVVWRNAEPQLYQLAQGTIAIVFRANNSGALGALLRPPIVIMEVPKCKSKGSLMCVTGPCAGEAHVGMLVCTHTPPPSNICHASIRKLDQNSGPHVCLHWCINSVVNRNVLGCEHDEGIAQSAHVGV